MLSEGAGLRLVLRPQRRFQSVSSAKMDIPTRRSKSSRHVEEDFNELYGSRFVQFPAPLTLIVFLAIMFQMITIMKVCIRTCDEIFYHLQILNLHSAAWGRDDEFQAEADEKKSELLWAVLASYLPTGSFVW